MALSDYPLWRKPRHHEDLKESGDHVHWVELFYDLMHVVTIFLLGNYLSQHLSLGGFAVFALMFTVFWFAWGEISVYNSIYISTDIWHRLIMTVAILTVMFMAASIPAVTDKSWPFFALAFAANRWVLAALYLRAKKAGPKEAPICNEMARNFFILGICFAACAFLPKPMAFWCFGILMVMTQAIYSIPAISPMRFERFSPRFGHFSERFALLMLIILGEGFFKLAVTLAEKGIYKVSPEVLFNFAAGGISTFLLSWIYFDLVAHAAPRDQRFRTLVLYWLGHLVLMLCAVMIGVAVAAEVKVGFWDPFPLKYAYLGSFGLMGYFAALWIIQTQTERKITDDFATGRLRLFGILVIAVGLFLVNDLPAIVGNLIWTTALLSQTIFPMYLGWRAHQGRNTSP